MAIGLSLENKLDVWSELSTEAAELNYTCIGGIVSYKATCPSREGLVGMFPCPWKIWNLQLSETWTLAFWDIFVMNNFF